MIRTLGYICSDTHYKGLGLEYTKMYSSLDAYYSDKQVDLNRPLLIVGLKNAKEYANRANIKFNILDRKFSDNVYWTFKKTEKRDAYEVDLKVFYKLIEDKAVSNIEYSYINLYRLSYSNIKKLYNQIILKRNENHIVFIDNNMIYYQYGKSKTFGISLSILEYIGIAPIKVTSLIKKNASIKIYYPISDDIKLLKKTFANAKYAIPHLIVDTV